MKVDLHIHSNYSDGLNSIEEILEEARSKNLEAVAIVDHGYDHSKGILHCNVAKREVELEALRGQYEDIKILSGIEADINLNGHINLYNDKYDLVLASTHEYYADEEYLRLVEAAVCSGKVDALAHYGWLVSWVLPPDDLMLKEKELAALMKEHNVAVELNSLHEKPGIEFIKLCAEAGLMYTIGSDSHRAPSVGNVEWAVRNAKLFFDESKLFLGKDK